MRRLTLIAIPYLWLVALFLVPFLIVMKISLSEYALSIPPYSPYLDLSAGWAGHSRRSETCVLGVSAEANGNAHGASGYQARIQC